MRFTLILLALAVVTLGAAGQDIVKKCKGGAVPPPAREYVTVKPDEGLSDHKDQVVKVEGRISQIPWQHLIHHPEGYSQFYYFDYGKGLQTVIYAKTPIECGGTLTLWGTVLTVGGQSKRPDRKETGVEYQLQVDKWECK
ncbi:MAG: hypothetical protein KA419_16970 [Acidobacteria bacterium]|nr:hypothetical protein [Acidobacteriota bacterium]